MKIILLHCGVGLEDNEFKPRVDPNSIHHGLCSISASIKSKGYTDVTCLNLCKMKDLDEFTESAKKLVPQTDVFGVSIMSADFEVALKCIKIVKSINKNIKVIVGGIHPTIMLHEVEPHQEIDFIITGEGEISFTKLLDDISNNNPSERVIKGIPPHDLDNLPFVDSELMGRDEPEYLSILPKPFVTILTSRGCMYNCRFCQPSEKILFGKKVRARSIDNVIEELKLLRDKYQFKSLMIHDDSFTQDKKRVLEFCEKYKKNGFNQPFVILSRADFICKHEDAMQALAEAGLKLVSIGFESGSQRILNFLNKGTIVEQYIKAGEICRKYGIKFKGNFMLGVPTETKEETQQTLELTKKIRPYWISVTFFTPIPGSYLTDYVMENNLSLVQSHKTLNRSDLSSAKIKGIDYDFLRDIAAQIYETQTFLEDNIEEKITALPDNIKSNLKILTFRSAPVDRINKILSALDINGLKTDLIVQAGFSSHFEENSTVETQLSVDCQKFSKDIFTEFIPLLQTAGYNTAFIPLNSWDYNSYQDIYETVVQIGIKHIFGIAPNSQIVDIQTVFTDALV